MVRKNEDGSVLNWTVHSNSVAGVDMSCLDLVGEGVFFFFFFGGGRGRGGGGSNRFLGKRP